MYSTSDSIQSHGGNEHGLLGQEFGSADRTLSEVGPVWNVEVESSGHSAMHSAGVCVCICICIYVYVYVCVCMYVYGIKYFSKNL